MSTSAPLLGAVVAAVPLLARAIAGPPRAPRVPNAGPSDRGTARGEAPTWAGRPLRRDPTPVLLDAVRRDLPDVVDLLLLCTSAGLSLAVAHPQVALRVPAHVGAPLTAAQAAAGAGQSRADALVDALGPLGAGARQLAHVLADHLRYGTPLAPGLERLATDLRVDRRRRAEAAARRVPVRLLGPLVLCQLPAFALLTVVPLVAASLRGLPT